MSREGAWFSASKKNRNAPRADYLSAEFGLTESPSIFAVSLGVLADDPSRLTGVTSSGLSLSNNK
jgi:hypothetical protein